MSGTTRSVAILNADIVGYTRHVADDPASAADGVRELTAIARRETSAAGGRLVDFVGDNFLAVFDSSRAAVRGAVAICRSIRTRNATLPIERRMRFRMGIDRGAVLEADDGSLVGEAVNVAARLQSLAPAGGITVSDRVYLDLDEPELRFTPLGDRRLKNVDGRTPAYRLEGVVPETDEDALPNIRPRTATVLVLPPVVHGDAAGIAGAVAALRLDLVTALVRLPDLDVVDGSRGATIGDREVDYTLETEVVVLDGSVRIYTHIVEWATINKVWGRRWTMPAGELVERSDEIVSDTVHAVEIDLVIGEPARLYREEMGTGSLDEVYGAWSDLMTDTPQSWAAAVTRLEKLASDHPESTVGPALAAFAHWYGVVAGFSPDPLTNLSSAAGHARVGVEMGDVTGLSHMVIAGIALIDGSDLDQALAAAQTAAERRPTCDATFAVESSIHRYRGSWQDGIVAGRRAVELSNGSRAIFALGLAGNLWVGGRYREALDLAEQLSQGDHPHPELALIRAASYEGLGMRRRANAAMQEFLTDHPDADAATVAARHPFRDPALRDRWVGALVDAGLPAS